jgi:hypothetical protein
MRNPAQTPPFMTETRRGVSVSSLDIYVSEAGIPRVRLNQSPDNSSSVAAAAASVRQLRKTRLSGANAETPVTQL